jgi:phosphatidylinositol-bisphosphatase
LDEWILPNRGVYADIYVIGFQEMVDLNAMNVIADNSKSQQRSVFWSEKIASCLGTIEGVSYRPIASKYLVGLLICVFAKESVAEHIKDVRTSSLGVGIMGMLGNKGGVSVRMWIYDTSCCFVCSHLAAHRENVAGRNSDFKNILERSEFPCDSGQEGPSDENRRQNVIRPRHGADKTRGVDLTILDHELIFWLGDLNYRFDEELTTNEVFECCTQNNLSLLREHDQLIQERKKGE